MKKLYLLTILASIALSFMACNSTTPTVSAKSQKPQDIQVFTTKNQEHKITPKSIEKEFNAVGLNVAGNNDMNKPFKIRFGKVHYPLYNLAMYINNDLTFNLIKKYPKFGALTPLTMSIWEDKNGNINIATLTINGMARATNIPIDDPDLIAYSSLIKKALKQALPNGHFKKLSYNTTSPKKSFAIDMTMEVDTDEPMEDFIDDFEAEFEGELEPLGFLLPNFTNVQEEIFNAHNYYAYDFYHTYSICKFDVIYPVSQFHPEAGAWAPCSFYIYKKKNEPKMHMGFLGVDNWISTLNIKDKESIKQLKQAEAMIVDIITEITQ